MQVGVLGVCRGWGSDSPPWIPPPPTSPPTSPPPASQSQHFQQVIVLFKFKFILIDVHFCGVPRADLMHDILYDFLIGVNMSISLNRSFISSENNHTILMAFCNANGLIYTTPGCFSLTAMVPLVSSSLSLLPGPCQPLVLTRYSQPL